MTFVEKRQDLRMRVPVTKEEKEKCLKQTLEWYLYVRGAKEPVKYWYRAVGYVLEALRPFDPEHLPDCVSEHRELIRQLLVDEVTDALDRR